MRGAPASAGARLVSRGTAVEASRTGVDDPYAGVSPYSNQYVSDPGSVRSAVPVSVADVSPMSIAAPVNPNPHADNRPVAPMANAARAPPLHPTGANPTSAVRLRVGRCGAGP